MPDAVASRTLEGEALAFVASVPPRFGTLATIDPDGTPHLAVVWYEVRPDGTILLNSRIGRRWPTNLLRDPRCTMAVEDRYRWVSVRGEVQVVGDRAQGDADIAALARRYHADDPDALERALEGFRGQERVSYLLHPRGVSVHL
jgi:PPOX class probable F420-dependent enzyme